MNTSPRNQSDLVFGAEPRAPRTPRVGELLWTIRKVDGTALACELRDDGAAGVELHVLRDRGFLFSQRFANRTIALLESDVIKSDYLAAGGTLVD